MEGRIEVPAMASRATRNVECIVILEYCYTVVVVRCDRSGV